MIRESNTKKKTDEELRDMRHPKSQGEKRVYSAAKDQGVKVRAKRNPENIGDYYDGKSAPYTKQNSKKKPDKKTIRKEEDEQSVYKQMKKNNGKVAFDGPEVKQRKHFAPGTKTEPSGKQYKRKGKNGNAFDDEDEESGDDNFRDKYGKGKKKKGNPKFLKKDKDKTPLKDRIGKALGESISISKFIEAIMTKNHAQAHKQLKSAVNGKIQKRIAQEIDKPLF